MGTELLVCGARGTFPVFGKEYEIYGQATSCYVIKDGDYAIVLDCGTGLANAAEYIKDCRVIDVILSHIHYDHIMGLYMMSKVFAKADVAFYGNFESWTSVSQRSKYGAHSFWPSTITRYKQINIRSDINYKLEHGFNAIFKPATHGDGAMMVSILKDGKRLCFTGDNECIDTNKFAGWIMNCDLLLFDGSYTPWEYEKHKGWGHSSWGIGCELARDNNVKKLLITHYSMENNDKILAEHEKRAKEIFRGTEFAKEGSFYEI